MAAEATLKMLLLGEDRSAGSTLKGVGKDADTTAGKFRGFAKTASVALAGGLLVAGAAALKMGKAAAQDEAAASKLAQTMQKAAGATKGQIASTEEWITAQGKAYGVADDDLRPALSKLVVATHDVGKAQHLASLAMDVSAGTGKDLGAVSMALAKAQNGNVGALGRLGIATKDADGKTKSLHQITKDLAATYSGAAATAADTTAGKQKRLTVALSEAGETIGYKLLPFMLKLTDAGTAALGWMQKHGTLVKIIAAALGGLAAMVVAVSAAVRVWTAVQTVLNVVLAANPIGLLIVGLAALVAAFVLAYKNSQTFRDIVNGALHAIAAAFQAVWNGVLAPVFQLWGKAIGTLLSVWGHLAIAVGTALHIGWIKDLGHDLLDAAGKASNLNLKLDIVGTKHPHPTVDSSSIDAASGKTRGLISLLDTLHNRAPKVNVPTPGMFVPHHAVGDRFFAGGATWVGERGPELVNLPRGSSIATADQSARMGAGGSADLGTLVVVVRDEQANVIERKLAKLKRDRGGLSLAFV